MIRADDGRGRPVPSRLAWRRATCDLFAALALRLVRALGRALLLLLARIHTAHGPAALVMELHACVVLLGHDVLDVGLLLLLGLLIQRGDLLRLLTIRQGDVLGDGLGLGLELLHLAHGLVVLARLGLQHLLDGARVDCALLGLDLVDLLLCDWKGRHHVRCLLLDEPLGQDAVRVGVPVVPAFNHLASGIGRHHLLCNGKTLGIEAINGGGPLSRADLLVAVGARRLLVLAVDRILVVLFVLVIALRGGVGLALQAGLRGDHRGRRLILAIAPDARKELLLVPCSRRPARRALDQQRILSVLDRAVVVIVISHRDRRIDVVLLQVLIVPGAVRRHLRNPRLGALGALLLEPLVLRVQRRLHGIHVALLKDLDLVLDVIVRIVELVARLSIDSFEHALALNSPDIEEILLQATVVDTSASVQ
eukprot:m.70348 g.70348  ORF g.70348 m.70348 type:complete len:422 (-) comp7587_c1_seq1:1131-2396(-)